MRVGFYCRCYVIFEKLHTYTKKKSFFFLIIEIIQFHFLHTFNRLMFHLVFIFIFDTVSLLLKLETRIVQIFKRHI